MLHFLKCFAAARATMLPHSSAAKRASSSVAVGGEEAGGKMLQERLCRVLGARLSISPSTARFVVEQTKKGSTVPFLARYRRDETGNMDETALRQLIDMAEELQEVERRRSFMLRSLRSRGLLTAELQESFEKLLHLNQLEDAWEPFKEKKSSLSHRGREAGLEPLAKELLYTTDPMKDISEKLNSVTDGAKLFQAIIVEEVQRCEEVRQLMLVECRKSGIITSSLVANPRKKNAKEIGADAFDTLKKQFAAYENRRWSVQRISAHHVLALQRGESKGVLLVKMISHSRTKDIFFSWARRKFIGLQRQGQHNTSKLLHNCIEAAYEHIIKSTHTIVRRDLKKSAEKEAIAVFAHSLRHIIMQCPMREARILAMDPGVTNGVKCVALDENGAVLTRFKCIIMDKPNMKNYISSCVEKLNLNKIVIGNGTASREVADIVADTIEQRQLNVEYAIVSEAGASVYSVSDVAKEEFPSLDPMYRGAVSIGRRVIDPLSELVKIPVRSMGIGMYQHDISEIELIRALNRVVESCVACVGVNTLVTNRYVMEKIPGVNKRIVDQIVLSRYAKKLKSRDDLRRVPGMTESMYQQIAGFFRFPNSPNPLDNTNIHPESYSTVDKLLELYKGKERREVGVILLHLKDMELQEVARSIGCGRATLELVARELVSPALDPRSELPHAGLFRRAPQKPADLKPGHKLKGVVQTVTTFGVFVDVGLHDNVLVRGVNLDTVHAGSLLDDLRFEGLDQLGRVQVRYDGVLHAPGNNAARSQHQGLALESEDFFLVRNPGSAEVQPTLSDSLAAVREKRQQLFAPSSSCEGDGGKECTGATSAITRPCDKITKPIKRSREDEDEVEGIKAAADAANTTGAKKSTAKPTKLLPSSPSSTTRVAATPTHTTMPDAKRKRTEKRLRDQYALFLEGNDVGDKNKPVGDLEPWWRTEEKVKLNGDTAGKTGTVKEDGRKRKVMRKDLSQLRHAFKPLIPTTTTTTTTTTSSTPSSKEGVENNDIFFF